MRERIFAAIRLRSDITSTSIFSLLSSSLQLLHSLRAIYYRKLLACTFHFHIVSYLWNLTYLFFFARKIRYSLYVNFYRRAKNREKNHYRWIRRTISFSVLVRTTHNRVYLWGEKVKPLGYSIYCVCEWTYIFP